MGNRLMVAFSLGLVLAATTACGDDDGGGGSPQGDAALGDGSVGPGDSGIPMDASLDGAVDPDGSMVGPDGQVVDGATDSDAVAPPGPNTKVISAAGGSVSSADGRLTVTFPQDALSRPITISVTPVEPAPEGAAGTAYLISPAAEQLAQFGRPVRVEFEYTAADLAGGSPLSLQLGRFEAGAWLELPNLLPYPNEMVLRADLPKLGVVGLFTGVCVSCPTTCDATTCKFPPDSPTGIPGNCVVSGNGCGSCVPLCDTDNDGYCIGSPGGDQPGGDCNGSDATVYPGAPELCNGIDDDCDGYTDEGCQACASDAECTSPNEWCDSGVCVPCNLGCTPADCSFYLGEDVPRAPGRCLMRNATCNECVPSCDGDGDGYCTVEPLGANNVGQRQGTDCDDANPRANPEAVEVCGNGIDDNCDGAIDNGCQPCTADTECTTAGTACVNGVCEACPPVPCAAETCRFPLGAGPAEGVAGRCVNYGNACSRCVPTCDADGDGQCSTQQGDFPGGDCNDSNANIYSGAADICGDNIDNDCDFHTDEGCTPCANDAACTAGGEACIRGVCDVCPGSFDPSCYFGFVEGNPMAGVPGRRRDYGTGCSECVPQCDMDGDGYCPTGNRDDPVPGGDCDDEDINASPESIELCDNAKDDDCDGLVDEFCTVCAESLMCGEAQACTSGV